MAVPKSAEKPSMLSPGKNRRGALVLPAGLVECVNFVSIKGRPELDIGRSGLPERRVRSRDLSKDEGVL